MSGTLGGRSSSPVPDVATPRVWLCLAVILAAGALVYAASLRVPFVFDDHTTVVENAQIRDMRHLGGALPAPLAGRPLVNLSLAINYAISGLDVASYHVVNIALHLTCALLIFGIVRRTAQRLGERHVSPAGPAGFALAVSLLWTVHPLASEVVTYVTMRTESMMAACLLLTMYASIRALEDRSAIWAAAAVLACAAGTACDETIVVAPLLVVLYDGLFAFRSIAEAIEERWRLYAGLAASWILLAVLAVSAHGQPVSFGLAAASVSPWTYLLNQTMLIPHYLRLAVWPDSLVVYYGWPRALTIGDVWPYPAIVIGLFAATAYALVRRPVIGFVGAWLLLLLAPSSSLLPVAAEVGAERRMYLPLAALVTLFVMAALYAWRRLTVASTADAHTGLGSSRWRLSSTVAIVLTMVVAVMLGTATVARTREYRSPLTLAETVLARWPTANAQYLVGTELATLGRHNEAIPHFREAVRGYRPARVSLASELVATGKLEDAIAELQTFVIEEPTLPPTPSSRALVCRAHGLLADALAKQREFVEAIPHYREFLDVHARDGNAWTGLGVALAASGKPADAIGAFRNAVTADPDNGHFRQNLAQSLLERGDIGGAEEQAARATALDPRDPGAFELLGRALADQGKVDAARSQFARSLELDPSNERARRGLRAIEGRLK